MNNIRTELLEWFKKNGGIRLLGYVIAIGTVAGVAARVSYSHIRDVTWIFGQAIDVAALLPLSVDGMLLACTLAMAQDKAKGLRPRGWARFGFWSGAIISVLCNAADTLVHASVVIARVRAILPADILDDQQLIGIAIFVAILAPAILLITTEVMAREGKPKKNQARSEAAKNGWEKRRSSKPTRKPARRSRKPAAAQVSPGMAPVVPSAKELDELVG